MVTSVGQGLEQIIYILAVVGEEGIAVVETAGGSPARYLDALKKSGAKVMHKATSVKHALKAQSLGVELRPMDVRDPGEIERAIVAFAQVPNGGLIIAGAPLIGAPSLLTGKKHCRACLLLR